MSETQNNIYHNLIEQAYIDPIKSVLAIDDQFQSLDTLLDKLDANDPSLIKKERSKQISTLKMARKRNWLADMHDGQDESDARIYDRLHQCDLLLLDYHLDESNQNDPTKALDILERLNSNHHFNLVIVYTAAENLEEVQSQILLKLSSPKVIEDLPTPYADTLFEQWEDDGEEFADELYAQVTDSELVLMLNQTDLLNDRSQFDAIFERLEPIIEDAEVELSNENKQQIFVKLLKQKLKENQLKGDFRGDSKVSTAKNIGKNWLKTDKLFIAVISKEEVQPEELPSALKEALIDWGPTSNRLLLSKIKHELDDNGQSFENEVLNCEYTNAGWLEQFAKEDNGTRLTVERLMDGLSKSLSTSKTLTGFSDLIRERINTDDLPNVLSQESTGNIDWSSKESRAEIYKALNCYIGTKEVVGDFLVTGHIIEWKKDDGDNDYLLCLTPACDLVPSQVKSSPKAWKSRLQPFIAFQTIKLIKSERKPANDLADINKRPMVIFKVGDNSVIYTVEAQKGQPVSNEQVFARNLGEFDANNHVVLVRNLIKDTNLENVEQKCHVIAQLRYEYALSLLQRLGQDLSRIGLDYVAL